nr:tyrosine-type recombinase/integrase [Pseudomonas sp. Irchel s3h17]
MLDFLKKPFRRKPALKPAAPTAATRSTSSFAVSSSQPSRSDPPAALLNPLNPLSPLSPISPLNQVTDKENPASGVRKNKETPRDFYADTGIWNAVYGAASSELKDAMDLAYFTAQRPADVLSMRATDVIDGFLQVAQGKTSKKLRIRLDAGEIINGLGELIQRLLEQRKARAVRNPYLIVTEDGRRVTAAMLRLRFDDARNVAFVKALEGEDPALAASIRQFQFRDIRPKAASEIDDLGHASRLLGHTDKRITETVYRRVGEIVKPTR